MSLVVKTTDWTRSLETQQDFEGITREVLGDKLAYMDEIEIHDGMHDTERQKHIPPQNRDNRFVINIFATPSKVASVRLTPKKIWGHPMAICESGERMYEPSGDGLVIVDPKTGDVMAELVGNSLYFLFRANSDRYSDRKSRNAIYRGILLEAVKFLRIGLPTLEQCQRGEFPPIDRDLLGRIKMSMHAHRAELEQHMAQRGELDRQFADITNNTSESDRAIKLLANIPEIKKVEVQGDKLILFTHVMYALSGDGKQLYELGEFKVTLSFGDKADASFSNLTRRPFHRDERYAAEYGHPHVDRSKGHWCQGEGAWIIKLLQNFEFEAATLFALKAIDSVNEDDAYQRILQIFPRAVARMEYPKERAPLSPETLRAFQVLYSQNRQTREHGLKARVVELLNQIDANRRSVFYAALANTLGVLKPQEVASKVHNELEKLWKLKEVREINLLGSTLHVVFSQLEVTDISTDQVYSVGPLHLQFNTRDDAVRVINPFPIYHDRFGAVHVPQLGATEKDAVGIGQLSLVVPELLGSLEIESAVIVTLNFLKEFDGKKVNPSILESMGKLRVAEKAA